MTCCCFPAAHVMSQNSLSLDSRMSCADWLYTRRPAPAAAFWVGPISCLRVTGNSARSSHCESQQKMHDPSSGGTERRDLCARVLESGLSRVSSVDQNAHWPAATGHLAGSDLEPCQTQYGYAVFASSALNVQLNDLQLNVLRSSAERPSIFS